MLGLLSVMMTLGVTQLLAHVTEIRVNQNQDGTLTWYLQTYHYANECGHANAGLSINGVQYNISAEYNGSIVGLSSTVVAAYQPDTYGGGRHSYAIVNTPYIPGTLNVAPYSNNVCWAFLVGGNSSFNPPPPPVCTTPTIVGISTIVSLAGSDNGTSCDPTDDHTTAVVKVSHLACASITGDKQFSIVYDPSGANVVYGPYNYATGTETDVTINIPYGATSATQVKAYDGFPSSAQGGLTIPGGQYLGQRETVPPTVTVPANASIVNTPGQCGGVYTYSVTASDNCSVSSLVQTAGLPSGSVFPVGTTVNTFLATDPSGNTTSASFSVTVTDNQAPVFTPVFTIPVSTGSATITIPNLQTPVSSWSPVTYNFSDPLPAGAVVTGIDLTYSGVDQGWGYTGDYNSLYVSGTHIGGNQYFHYPQNFTLNYTGAIPGYVYGGTNTFQMYFTGYPGWQGFLNNGKMTIHYTIMAPTANPPATVVNNDPGICGAVVSLNTPPVTDNCGILSLTNDAPAVFPVGTTTVTWTATDIHQNTSTLTQAVTVKDIEKPTLTAPANISVNNDAGKCGATINIGTPATHDNCAVATVTNDHASTTYPVGTTTVTWTVTDIHGNSSTATQTITVTDNEKPKVQAPADWSVVNDPGVCGANISNTGNLSVSDNCGIASITNDHPSTYYPVGTTIVTWTVTDIHGNVTDTAKQAVTVIDNEKPTITAPADLTVNNDAGQCGATINIGTPATADNCGVASVSNDHASATYPVGTTVVTWTVIDIHGYMSTAKQTIIVNDNEKPTITAPSNISVNNDAGVCEATVQIGTPVTADNCAVATITNDHASTTYPVGTTTVTWTVTDIHGNSNTTTQTITVTDNEKPVITVPADQVFCANADGSSNYTIPVSSATDNCGVATVSYAVSGATTRTGSGYDASGSFNIGTSTITWTVTDIHGNVSVSSSSVVVNPLPVASFVSTDADQFCNQVTLTGSSTINPAGYSWSSTNAPGSFSTSPQLSLGQTNGDGNYYLYVQATNTGCVSASSVVYNYQKQNLVSSYTILAYDEVKLGMNNTVASGSVGVMAQKGEAEFKSNTTVSSPGSFVKAKKIDIDGKGVVISTPIYAAATGITLPTMYYNTASTQRLSNMSVRENTTSTLSGNYGNLTLKKGSVTTLTGTVFGSIKVEQGAQVTFTAPVVSIDKLDVSKGPRNGYSYVRFSQDTKVLVSKSVSIGSQVYVNPDNYKVTFYVGSQKVEKGKGKGEDHDRDEEHRNDDGSFSVHGGDTKVTANIYMPDGKLKVTGGYAYGDYGKGKGDCDKDDDDEKDYGKGSSYVYMTGLFISEEVEGNGKNVIWNSFSCGAAPVAVTSVTKAVTQTVSKETAVESLTNEELKVTVMPNPSTTYFTLKLESKYSTPVNMRVMDASGRVVDAKSKIGSNSTIQIGHNYISGTYFAEMIQGNKRKVVQLIKGRG
ncbi:MAG: HYR domain-containing protein [Bacteroidota bacterium]|nr:HYR domain-containing protein [Bacteroidota bacterium]